jgi:hypothetical protein
LFLAPVARATIAPKIEILAYRHVGEDAAAFRHLDETARNDRRRFLVLDGRPGKANGAAPGPHHAGDGAVERRFPDAV